MGEKKKRRKKCVNIYPGDKRGKKAMNKVMQEHAKAYKNLRQNQFIIKYRSFENDMNDSQIFEPYLYRGQKRIKEKIEH